MNFIRNDRSYIQQRCSTQTTLENYDRALNKILNGYPENIADETKNQQKQVALSILNKITSDFKSALISEQLDHNYITIRENLAVVFDHKS